MQRRRCGGALDVRRYLATEVGVGNEVGEGIAFLLTAYMFYEMFNVKLSTMKSDAQNYLVLSSG